MRIRTLLGTVSAAAAASLLASSPLVHAKNAQVKVAGGINISALLVDPAGSPASGLFQYQSGAPAKMLVAVKNSSAPAGAADVVINTRDINCVDQPAIHVSGGSFDNRGQLKFQPLNPPTLPFASKSRLQVQVLTGAGQLVVQSFGEPCVPGHP
ncbi:MAG: hypothetical protein E6G17_06555 [Actinobacteria bacterium]|nr:MAG: hypothetical protein E6G17_06555 [Actinomycetota bacterium]